MDNLALHRRPIGKAWGGEVSFLRRFLRAFDAGLHLVFDFKFRQRTWSGSGLKQR